MLHGREISGKFETLSSSSTPSSKRSLRMLIQHFCFNIEGASQISRNTNSSHSKNLRSSDPVTAQGLQNFASLPSPLCYLHKYFNNATSLPLLRAESTSHNIYTLTFTFSWNNSLSLPPPCRKRFPQLLSNYPFRLWRPLLESEVERGSIDKGRK